MRITKLKVGVVKNPAKRANGGTASRCSQNRAGPLVTNTTWEVPTISQPMSNNSLENSIELPHT